jgi:hypothetical protein
MQLPTVSEISAVSAHRREVELVRWSLLAVPEARTPRGEPDPGDPLRRVQGGPRRTTIAVARR